MTICSLRAALVVLTASFLTLDGAVAVQAQAGKDAEQGWRPLFDGKTLTNWQSTKFVGEGAVKVENGQIILEAGGDLTGINWTGPELPTTNYELALQAMRVEGRDFFAGVTFPVADSFCSLILGGWGGSVVGLSSINGMDASENDTSQSVEFESGRWYNIRIRVTTKIEAWLDERQIVSVELKGNKIDTRIEMHMSQPLGVASWRTKSALREIRLRRLQGGVGAEREVPNRLRLFAFERRPQMLARLATVVRGLFRIECHPCPCGVALRTTSESYAALQDAVDLGRAFVPVATTGA